MLWNITDQTGRLLLGQSCDYDTALYHLKIYRERYPFGGLYPNGKGRYWFIFNIVRVGDIQWLS